MPKFIERVNKINFQHILFKSCQFLSKTYELCSSFMEQFFNIVLVIDIAKIWDLL